MRANIGFRFRLERFFKNQFGDCIDLDPDSSNFVDPDTINLDPQHCKFHSLIELKFDKKNAYICHVYVVVTLYKNR